MSGVLLENKPAERVSSVARPARAWWLQTGEAILLLPVLLLLLEGFFSLAGVGQAEFLEPDPVLGVRHIAGKRVVWRLEGYSDEHLSRQGLRDVEHALTKPPGVMRVALLGDSATEGLQVPLAETYGCELQRLLNSGREADGGRKVEVINFGCSSYSNGQELLQLRRHVVAFQPDLVILMYNRGDYIENIRDPRHLRAEPRPYFYLGNQGELLEDTEVLRANDHLFHPDPIQDFLRRSSGIYGVLSHMNLALSLNEPLYAKTRNSIFKKLDRAAGKSSRGYRQAYPIQDVWRVAEEIFKECHRECQKADSQFMVVCFPNIVKDKDYSGQIGRLKELAGADGFPCVDLTEAYLSASNSKELFLKYHFSAAGHRLAATLMEPAARKLLQAKLAD